MGATSQHFSHKELACRHCNINECTPRLVDALEQLRAAIREQVSGDLVIKVNDAYRCRQHDIAVGGVGSIPGHVSQHTLGNAADITVVGLPVSTLYSIARTIETFRGFGRGDAQNYLHVDVRILPPGNVARWCYDVNGRQTVWYDPKRLEGVST